MSGVLRSIFAVTDGVDPVGVNAHTDKDLTQRQGATLAERAVVLLGTSFIAVAFDFHGISRVGLKEIRDTGNFGSFAG